MNSRRPVQAFAVVGVLAIAACGSDAAGVGDSTRAGSAASAPPTTEPRSTSVATTSPPATDSGGKDAVAAAEALVEQYSGLQPSPTVEPLPGPPPDGLEFAVLSCGFPTCVSFTEGMQAAADALGWTTSVHTTEITPEDYVAAWEQILLEQPDVIAYMALLPNELIADQLARAQQAGIATVALGGSDRPDGVGGVFAGAEQLAKSGQLMGAATVADSGGAPRVLFVWDPNSEAIMGPVRASLEEQVSAGGGTVDVLDVAAQDIGRAVPAQVVSHLQSNPEIQYVAFTVADFGIGVPDALAAAGIDGVKLLGRSPSPPNVANIQAGTEWLQVAEEGVAAGYRAVDALLRLQAGVEFDRAPEGWHQILTVDTVTDPASALQTPGVPDAYLDAWGVTG